MTEHNHRRGTRSHRHRLFSEHQEVLPDLPEGIQYMGSKKPGDTVFIVETKEPLRNGYAPDRAHRYIDHSLHGWGDHGKLSNKIIGSKTIGNDFVNGHRGEAKSVRGAKKFVRSRIRFHENAATRKLTREINDD